MSPLTAFEWILVIMFGAVGVGIIASGVVTIVKTWRKL